MLFINDDQAKVAKRQIERGPRPDHQLRSPLPDHAPDPAAFGHGHAGMPLSWHRAETCLNPFQEFRRERNFRQQDQGLPALAQAGGYSLKVNLRLTRAGDTLQECCTVASPIHPCLKCGSGGGLIF